MKAIVYEGAGWIEVAQDRVQLRAVVNTVKNIWFS
jgi:hypothetical protein